MSFITRIWSALFRRTPRYEVSAYRDLYTALVSTLTREGIHVGGTAGYPRVEVNTIREQERLDKEGALRQLTVVVESISNTRLSEAVTMNEDNLRLLTETELQIDGWTCLGILPTQLQDATETTDSNKILYRLMQEFTVWMEKIKEDDPVVERNPDAPIEMEEPEQENN